MAKPLSMFNFDLSHDIEQYLLSHPSTKEYEVIGHLQSIGRIPSESLQQPLSLFRCHFLIFNALYRLQYRTHQHQEYQLNISSLRIELSPYPGAYDSIEKTLNHHDPLALFYTDLAQLNQTKEQDVRRLLNSFWEEFLCPQRKYKAFATLELDTQTMNKIDFPIIKKQYRRLIMKHHPDRGGSSEKMIEIHQAMQCLEQYYHS